MKPPTRTTRVTKSRDVRVHGELWHTSQILLDHGQERPEGCTHQFRASSVFTAFSLEAYLNWLGALRVPNWRHLQGLKPRNKVEVVAGQLGVSIDLDSLDAKLGVFLRTKWEAFCNEANAIRALEDVEAIANRLHTAAKFNSSESTYPFFTGFQVHGASFS